MTAIQFEERECLLGDELDNEFLLELDQSIFEIQPAIFSVKIAKECIIEDTERSLATYVETVDCERRKLVLSEKKLRLDLDDSVRQVAVRRSCIEEVRKRGETISQEILSLKAKKELKDNELKKKRQLLKEKYDAHVVALSYYKHNLQCYLDFEDEDWNICTFYFFKSSRNSSRKDYFVKLNNRDGGWELLAMTPQLPSFNLLQERLRTSNDIQGFIAHVYERFKHVKEASGKNLC